MHEGVYTSAPLAYIQVKVFSAFKNPPNFHRRTTKNKIAFKKSSGASPVLLRRAIASIKKKGWWRVSDGDGRASATYNWMEEGCGHAVLQTNFGHLASISLFYVQKGWTIMTRFSNISFSGTFWTEGVSESTDTHAGLINQLLSCQLAWVYLYLKVDQCCSGIYTSMHLKVLLQNAKIYRTFY